ncbi:MAG: M15 family metallopeptidase [Gemmatimonadota bacterium]
MTPAAFVARQRLSGTLLLVCVASALPPAGVLPLTAQAQVDRADSVFIRHARAELRTHGLPAAAISVAATNGPLWSLSWRGDDQAPLDAATAHRAGPLSELITRMAVHYLGDLGRLPLDSAIAPRLPELRLLPPDELTLVESPSGRALVAYLPEVTVRMLLEHRAGLPVDAPVGTRPGAPPASSAAQVVASLRGTRLARQPGEPGGPSRAGTIALAAAVEAVSGMPLAPLVREHLLEPLGMVGSALLPEVPWTTASAAWRRPADGRLLPAASVPVGAAAALGLVLPIEDAGRLAGALLHAGPGTVAADRPERADRAVAAAAAVGRGLEPTELAGMPALRHLGHGGGASAALLLLPDSGLAAVVLLPVEGAAALAERLAGTALRLALAERGGGQLVVPPATEPVPRAVALQWAGSYRGAERALRLVMAGDGLAAELPERVMLRLRGDTLWIDDPAHPREPLVPLDGGGLGFRGDSLAPLEPVPPRAPPPGWRGLIGEYGSSVDPLGVHEAAGGLRVRLDSRIEHGLQPSGADAFLLVGDGPYAGEVLRVARGTTGAATGVTLSTVAFPRRIAAGPDGFRIRPRRSIEVLRRDALAATPPREAGDFRTPDLVELRTLNPGIRYDIRYATLNNFMGAVFYRDALAFLQRPAAEALARVNERLRPLGYGLMVFDAYRPWHVTRMFWDATPDDLKEFVADPARGSRHNRGAAVDLTLYHLGTGAPVDMPSGYDEFTERAHADYPGGTALARWHRALLRHAMAAEGFTVYDVEWWHFDYMDWARWPIDNREFQEFMRR